jgi:hypothetical protein
LRATAAVVFDAPAAALLVFVAALFAAVFLVVAIRIAKSDK